MEYLFIATLMAMFISIHLHFDKKMQYEKINRKIRHFQSRRRRQKLFMILECDIVCDAYRDIALKAMIITSLRYWVSLLAFSSLWILLGIMITGFYAILVSGFAIMFFWVAVICIHISIGLAPGLIITGRKRILMRSKGLIYLLASVAIMQLLQITHVHDTWALISVIPWAYGSSMYITSLYDVNHTGAFIKPC